LFNIKFVLEIYSGALCVGIVMSCRLANNMP
jgi:hypothetical protein